MANHLESLTIACDCECSAIKYMEHSKPINVAKAIHRAYQAGWRRFDNFEQVEFKREGREITIEIDAECPACVFAELELKHRGPIH